MSPSFTMKQLISKSTNIMWTQAPPNFPIRAAGNVWFFSPHSRSTSQNPGRLRSKDDIEEGPVHMQVVGVFSESELFEPIQKETDS